MSSGSTCAVVGCTNNTKKVKMFMESECNIHRITRKECHCPPPYALHSMPVSKRPEWLAALKLRRPPKKVYVCSHHFVDKRPTEEHPSPELFLGYERPVVKKRRIIGRREALDHPPQDCEQERSPCSSQEDTTLRPIKEEQDNPWNTPEHKDPEPLQVKEEQEELWISQEAQQHQGPEETAAKDPVLSMIKISSVRSLSVQTQSDSSHLNQHIEEADDGADASVSQVKTEPDEDDYGASQQSSTDPVIQNNGHVSGAPGKLLESAHSSSPLLQTKLEISDHEESFGEQMAKGKKPFECPSCSKCYSTADSLRMHARIHAGPKSYTCRFCGETFSQSGHLTLHKRKHAGEKPFLCNICGKAFSKIGNRNVHLRTHTGEKPYHCTVCGLSFSQMTQMKTHFRTHTGEKPYSCHICSKSFTTSDSLKIHRRTHRAHSCDICSAKFSDAGKLKYHMMTHTGATLYQCFVCHQSFSDQSSLDRCMKTHGTSGRFS